MTARVDQGPRRVSLARRGRPMEQDHDFPRSGINKYVVRYIRGLPDLTGKTVVDIPCGDGRASYEFLRRGARIRPFDLDPSAMKVEGIEASRADFCEPLPLDDESVDYVICQEGIEHMPDQLAVLGEFNRVLKKGGRLLITTPTLT